MRIANKKTTAKVGRPSLRSFTVRRSDSHFTLSAKTANDLGLHAGMIVNILFIGKDMYLCLDAKLGFTLFGYKNGQKYTSFAYTAKYEAPKMLERANATKVATFLIAANAEKINGCTCYKIISTPLRVD